jgi:hypothetical protein
MQVITVDLALASLVGSASGFDACRFVPLKFLSLSANENAKVRFFLKITRDTEEVYRYCTVHEALKDCLTGTVVRSYHVDNVLNCIIPTW